MKLSELVECENCGEADKPTQHGRCATCGSNGVRWVVGEQPFLLASDFHREETNSLPSTKWCGIDREFLREMGVEA